MRLPVPRFCYVADVSVQKCTRVILWYWDVWRASHSGLVVTVPTLAVAASIPSTVSGLTALQYVLLPVEDCLTPL